MEQVVGVHMVACVGFDWNFVSTLTGMRGAWVCLSFRSIFIDSSFSCT